MEGRDGGGEDASSVSGAKLSPLSLTISIRFLSPDDHHGALAKYPRILSVGRT